MAGKDLEVPLQLSQAAQGGQHLGHAAAGEVRPPAGPGKEGVPAKEQIAAAEGDAALGVAGGVKDLDFYGVSPEGDPGPLVVEIRALDLGAQRKQGRAIKSRQHVMC